VAESPAGFARMCWRPLEPDAGNAAEGRSGDGLATQPCVIPTHGLFVVNHGLHGYRSLLSFVPARIEIRVNYDR